MPIFIDAWTERLFSLVPSKTDPKKTILDMMETNRSNPPTEKLHTRFLARKSWGVERINTKDIRLGLRDHMDLLRLGFKSERSLGRSRISDYFHKSFFQSDYWLLLATTFGFQPWHSLVEFRRYTQHFRNGTHGLDRACQLDVGRYNAHESVIAPLADFLLSRGVDFRFRTTVTDLIFEPSHQQVSTICAVPENEPAITIEVRQQDIVIVSVGSVISGATTGTNESPPSLELLECDKNLDDNWLLWLELSSKDSKFGNPYNFCTRVGESRQESFTATLKNNPQFFERFVQLTGDEPGTGTFVTLKHSSWLLTLSLPQQPMFPDQPVDVQVFWGYAAFPEKEGDYVKKPMLKCSGEEIMTEILHQLQFPIEGILPGSITIPCVMPRKSAPLLRRDGCDRPLVVPDGMRNTAVIGHFVEIPNEIPVSMDYCVRGAQMAINHLMGLG
jgi:oleate hydratase